MQSRYDCYLSKGIKFSNSQILDRKIKIIIKNYRIRELMQSCYDCYLSKLIKFSNSRILDKKNKNNNQEL